MKNQNLYPLFFLATFSTTIPAYEQVDATKMSFWETKQVVVEKFNDPAIPNITCYISHIHDSGWFTPANPSDSSLSCLKTHETPHNTLDSLRYSSEQEVYVKSQSIGDKTLRVKRKFDPISSTALYIAYTNQSGRGSQKHSISAVSLSNHTPPAQTPYYYH